MRLVPKVIGNDNEEMLDILARHEGIAVIKIPDGCRSVGGTRLIRVKTPFDRIWAKGGASAFLDYKTTAEGSFAFSAMDRTQVLTLLSLSAVDCTAGYVVYFRKFNRIIFYDADALFAVMPGKSLAPSDGVQCGSPEQSSLVNVLK